MDIQMPVMNGIDATLQIRQMELETAPIIIAMTADDQFLTPQTYQAAGMDNAILKPIDQQRLNGLLNQYVQQEL